MAVLRAELADKLAVRADAATVQAAQAATSGAASELPAPRPTAPAAAEAADQSSADGGSADTPVPVAALIAAARRGSRRECRGWATATAAA